jgi:phosphatidylglycerol:prolipoprotein diacylglycerol transferase
MYLVAFLVVYLLVKFRINRKEIFNDQASKLLLDFLLYVFVGLVIGARLGEVFFYNFQYYFVNPLAIISPFDPVTHEFVGIYGMSYHGGLIGVVVAAYLWTRKNKINFLEWANFIVPAIPLGYFFGRIGNFINGELYGRITTKWWGMYFAGDQYLRHPSQLYEAMLEGIVLFLILWPLRNHKKLKNNMLAIYLAGYAVTRFISEFFREPDGWIGFLTIGQFLSILMFLASVFVFLISRKSGTIGERKETKNNKI